MSVEAASGLLSAVGLYLGLGLVFALAFVAVGVTRVDPSAKGASIGFRLAILPGVTALWPWMLMRWLRAGALPEPGDAHRRAARAADERPS